jgi:hypothetical protein
MKPPIIDSITSDGEQLFAEIEGKAVPLSNFRESLLNQQKVYLVEPFTDRCPPTAMFSDWQDEDSDLINATGCIHDPWAAGIMRDFAAGKLPNGTHRRI